MKKVLAITLALLFVLSFVACGGNGGSDSGEKKPQAISDVESLIDGIGIVTTDSGDAITKAEEKYNDLSANEQAQVSNYDALKKAKEDYEDVVLDFLTGRWERNRVAKISYDNFSEGDKLKDTIVIFKWNARLVITNTTQHNVVVGDYAYECVIEDGLLKFKTHADEEDDVFSYQIDFENETLASVGNDDDLFYKKSDDPNYYIN